MTVTDDAMSNIVQLAEHIRTSEDVITEDSVALEFAKRYGDSLRYDHHVGKWYRWTGMRWEKEETKLAFAFARQLVRELVRTKSAKTKSICGKTGFSAGVERFAQSDRAFAVTSEIWDTDPFLLGTPDGVVDLRTGELRPARPEDYITKITSVAPDDFGDCPLWLKFLHEATGGNQEFIDFLQEFLGYALTGDVSEHIFLFLFGPGGNGKGVFINTIAGIFGDYATNAAMDTFEAASASKHTTDLAKLRGARLVFASETEEGQAFAEKRIKQLTGGDKITARFMRQDNFDFHPQLKLMMAGNHKPVLRNVDEAMKRRARFGPFVNKPKEIDRKLEEKLRAERGAILQWIIIGCQRWQAKGLSAPDIVKAATDEYFSEQDLVGQWIDGYCDLGKSLSDTAENLFKSWSAHALQSGEKPGTNRWFSQTLIRLGYKKVKYAPGIGHKRSFEGIAVKLVDTSDQHHNSYEREEGDYADTY